MKIHCLPSFFLSLPLNPLFHFPFPPVELCSIPSQLLMAREEQYHHARRHSQSTALSSSVAGLLTTPRNRTRSHSTSAIQQPCTPALATHLWESVNSKIKEIEDADSTGFLRYMDDHVQETWDSAKAAVVGAQRLLQFHELPKEWQENEYILSGYVCLYTVIFFVREFELLGVFARDQISLRSSPALPQIFYFIFYIFFPPRCLLTPLIFYTSL